MKKIISTILICILFTVTASELPKPIKCNETNHANCLKWNNITKGCHPIDCWKFNEITQQCEKAGKEFIPAIVLQSIPMTGVFGSGFGNIGRWDLFGMYMGIVFGPLLLLCTILCCLMQDGMSEDLSKALSACIQCLYGVAVTGFWIWGIVVIANKQVEAPWTDYMGNKIMCPLV